MEIDVLSRCKSLEQGKWGRQRLSWLGIWILSPMLFHGQAAVYAAEGGTPQGVSPDGLPHVSASHLSTTVVDVSAIPHLDDIVQPATTLEDWVTQIAQAEIVLVTGVTVESSDTDLVVVLESPESFLPSPTASVVGNALILDFTDVKLMLPDADAFQVSTPAAGIAWVSVINLPENRLRVSITGVEAPPAVDLRADAQGLILSVVPGAPGAIAQDEAIQLVVTGVQNDAPYRAQNTTTATRIDSSILEVPQSIQVVPREVLQDQGASTLGDVAQNVAGLNQFSTYQDFALRGFRISEESVFYNGLRGNPYNFFTNSPILGNVERVEVLRGPASVLYGQLQPGGFINIVTRQPEARPSITVTGVAGSYEEFGTQIDATGPIDARERLLYRLNMSHLGAGSFRDFQSSDYWQIAPSLTWRVGDRTALSLTGEWFEDRRRGQRDRGIVAPGGDVFAVPISFTVNEPGDRAGSSGHAIQLALNHELSDTWALSATGRFSHGEYFNRYHNPSGFLEDGRTMTRDYRDQEFTTDSFAADLYAVGKFSTGTLAHRLVFGVDTVIQDGIFEGRFADPIEFGGEVPALNVFNPRYGRANPETYTLLFDLSREYLRQYGLYIQDQITFSPQWQALFGLRYDFFDNKSDFRGDFGSDEVNFSDQALTFRGGVVYEPVENLFMYGSYSQGFIPQSEFNQGPDRGGPFDPEESWQIEVGAKTSLLSDRLTAAIAYYYINRENVLVTDPNNSRRLLQVGETTSQGIELEIAGRLSDHWRLFATYALNDAKVSEDTNSSLIGRQLENAPRHTASLWTRYDFPHSGFGVAGGFSFVDDRPTFDESVILPSYVVFDAALYYTTGTLRLALNFDNIFDTTHFIGGYDEDAIFPGDPFRVRFNASYEF
jgi:iron complex outermembrane receptor protein